MTDFKKILDEAGLDPETIVAKRKLLIRDSHDATFEGVGKIIAHTLDFCKAKGIGRGGALFILQGATEAALYAMAISCTYPPDLKGSGYGKVPFDSVLFAALLSAACSEATETGPNTLQAAHVMFEKITGRSFRDVFIDNCGCKHCKARRKRHGIKLNPSKTDTGL